MPWNNLGKAYGQKGNVSESIRHFTKASDLAPKQALYYRNLAAMLFAYPDQAARYYLIERSHVLPKVLSLFQQARKLDPKNFPLAADAAVRARARARLPAAAERAAPAVEYRVHRG